MVDMEEKNTCIYLIIADITLITLLLLADIAIFNRTVDKITIQNKCFNCRQESM